MGAPLKVTVVVADILYPPTSTIVSFIHRYFNQAGYATAVVKKSRQPQPFVPMAHLVGHIRKVTDVAVFYAQRYSNSDFCIVVQRVSIAVTRDEFPDAPFWIQELELFFALTYNPKTGHEWVSYDFLYTAKDSTAVTDAVKKCVHTALHERSGYMEAPSTSDAPHVEELMELLKKSLLSSVRILPPSQDTLM